MHCDSLKTLFVNERAFANCSDLINDPALIYLYYLCIHTVCSFALQKGFGTTEIYLDL